MRNIFEFFNLKGKAPLPFSLRDFWNVSRITEQGIIYSKKATGFMFEAGGLDGSFLSSDQRKLLHDDWRTLLRLSPEEEVQIVFRKRVEFTRWIEDQFNQIYLSDNPYGRRILLERLSDQVSRMGEDQPQLLSQKIIITFWTREELDEDAIEERRQLVQSQLRAFGFFIGILDKDKIITEINCSVQDLSVTELQQPEWPHLRIEAGHIQVNGDNFRALEMTKLPESYTELGMIQALTDLPYPIDLSVRIKGRDSRPIISRLERKRNLLNAQRSNRSSPSPQIESQMEQIDQVLRNLADRSEAIFEMTVTLGLRFPQHLVSLHRKALASVMRAGSQMDFCDFDEVSLGTFDAYLECIPGFSGKNLRTHTVLGSNAIHFLPFFRPSQGDSKSVATFQTRKGTLYGVDPVANQSANYNWLVSGTSGSGKSFFVNSLLAQSASIDPNIFIVDIGGSYNKLTQFLGGKVRSLEPGQGFELSPFFLPKSKDPGEERMRRQHIFQIFLEMCRIDGQLPSIEVRHQLSESLEIIFEMEKLPEHPISYLISLLGQVSSKEARRLIMLLERWAKNNFFGQFLDNDKVVGNSGSILAFDLKGLTEFEDLSRVVQLIVCASLWARIRQTDGKRFSWIVLDEIAFSLLKVQPLFVDELVSTLRKYFAGAVIVVQDLEKVTSSLAGSSILQNTYSKAILQQRGNPKNYSEVLSLSQVDQWAIESLSRKKGAYSDIFLIRDTDKTVIRHVPSELEYWLATTAPEDGQILSASIGKHSKNFQQSMIDFVETKQGVLK